MKRRNVIGLGLGLAALQARMSQAQELPTLMRIVVPFAPGGPFDGTARTLAEGLSQVTRRNVIVENRPGAGGTIGTAEVARGRPDGSVLLFTTGGHTTAPALHRKLPYDAWKDFTPVTQLTSSAGFLLLVPAQSPFATAADLLQAARARPGTLTYASAGVGNTTHLVGALFARAAAVDLVHVPYKGAGPIFADLAGGHVHMTFLGTTIAKPQLDAGRLRALAISGDQRAAEFPQVPAFAELGLRGVDVPAWGGLFAPAGVPEPLLDTIYQAVRQAAQRPAFVEESRKLGANVVVMPPRDFRAYVDSELRRYAAVLPPLGIQME